MLGMSVFPLGIVFGDNNHNFWDCWEFVIVILELCPVDIKGEGEVVWEKFGRCAESLANRRDPAGSF
jgi:hypothetical protein